MARTCAFRYRERAFSLPLTKSPWSPPTQAASSETTPAQDSSSEATTGQTTPENGTPPDQTPSPSNIAISDAQITGNLSQDCSSGNRLVNQSATEPAAQKIPSYSRKSKWFMGFEMPKLFVIANRREFMACRNLNPEREEDVMEAIVLLESWRAEAAYVTWNK
jgi:hypothetical protein